MVRLASLIAGHMVAAAVAGPELQLLPCLAPTCRLRAFTASAGSGSVRRLATDVGVPVSILLPIVTRFSVTRRCSAGSSSSPLPIGLSVRLICSLAELELELGRERRSAAREARRARGQHAVRPKALDKSNADLAGRMHASGEPVKISRRGWASAPRRSIDYSARGDLWRGPRRHPCPHGPCTERLLDI